MAKLQGDAAKVDLAGVELADLTRDADTNRQLFQNLPDPLQGDRRAAEHAGGRCPDPVRRRRADRAVGPADQVDPLIAFAASLVLGVLLVFMVERWDSDYGFRSADEIQARSACCALALVPDLSRRETQGNPAEDYILQKPNSAYAEERAADPHEPVSDRWRASAKTILVTSSVPLEGKSTIATSPPRPVGALRPG